jgi:hypothetical protein
MVILILAGIITGSIFMVFQAYMTEAGSVIGWQIKNSRFFVFERQCDE